MKLNLKILKAINEGIRKSLLSFSDIEFDKSDSGKMNQKVTNNVKNWQFIRENFVDLGLPSGTLWCKYNLGATCLDTEESWYGNYYMWGSTTPNNEDSCGYKTMPFNLGNSKFVSSYFNEYLHEFVDFDNLLHHEYDIAYQTNSLTHIPTVDLLQELKTLKCLWDIGHNGIEWLDGMIFYGNNGNELFIPAAGYRQWSGTELANYEGHIWSNTLDQNEYTEAHYMWIENGQCGVNSTVRCTGCSIRCVINKEDIV